MVVAFVCRRGHRSRGHSGSSTSSGGVVVVAVVVAEATEAAAGEVILVIVVVIILAVVVVMVEVVLPGTCMPCSTKGLSLIKIVRVEITSIAALFHWLKPLIFEGREETGVPGGKKNNNKQRVFENAIY